MNSPRKKSPRAPSMALDEAIDRTARVYEKERRHAAPIDVVAQDLGYKSANNGAALTAIASLRYFGLLERPKDGHLAVSKDFESYQFAPNDQMRRELVQKWLKTPPTFADLLEKYAEGLPSDATLRFDLIQKGFTPVSAESLIAVFKRSASFAGVFEAPTAPSAIPIAIDDPSEPAAKDQALPNRLVPAPEIEQQEGMDQIPVRLSGNRRAWLLIPNTFYNADKKRLKAQIDLLLTEDDEDDIG